jgi:hypothetical protein
MPIRNPDNYGLEWGAVALEIKSICGWRCQECDRQCTRPGEPYAGTRNVMTVAHLDPDSYSDEAVTVAALCSVCHLRYDAEYGMKFRRRYARIRQRQAGQLEWLWAAG